MRIGSFKTVNNIFLAPMAGITDLPFRLLCREQGCGLTYTEMVSAKGLYYTGIEKNGLLDIHPIERPCAIQLFGSDPVLMAEIAHRIEAEKAGEIGLIDINMGCPVRKVVNSGEGCALMKDLPLASRIIRSMSKAVSMPVTVKFRKGWAHKDDIAIDFAKMAEESGASAVTIHARTREQMYSGKADWETIARAKAAVHIPVIGNGDIMKPQDAVDMLKTTGCDAVMVARGAQGRPWIFDEILALLAGRPAHTPNEIQRIDAAKRHTMMACQYKGERAAIPEMRKHVAWYIKGMRESAPLRNRINQVRTLNEMIEILDEYGRFIGT
jgi:tRNA-dihydrouridine synthase B